MAKSIDFFKIGQVSGGAQPDIAGAVSKGLQTGIGLLEKIEADRKKADEEIAGVLNTIGDDYDPSLFEVESVRNTLTNILQNSKTKAAGLIQEKRKLSPLDARYNELTAEINSIRGSFDRLNKNALAYNNIAKQYAQIRKEKELTTAMDGRKVQDLDAILLNGRFNIKDDGKGNITYVAATGNEYTQEQLDDFAMPNYPLAKAYAPKLGTIKEKASKTGRAMTKNSEEFIAESIALGDILNNFSDEELRSSGVDGFVNGKPLFLSTPEEKEKLFTLEGTELKAFVQEKLMDNYINASRQGAALYKPPPINTGNLTQAQIDKRNQNKANKNRIDNVFKNAINAFNNKNLKASAFDNLVTLIGQDIVPVDLKRGIFKLRDKSIITDPDYIPPVINLSDPQNSIQKFYDKADLREGVDYTGLPAFNINAPTEPNAPTEEEIRTNSGLPIFQN